MGLKLSFISDASEAFIDFFVDKTLQEWESTDSKTIDSFSKAAGKTLFGDSPTTILHIDKKKKDDIAKLLKVLENKTVEDLERDFDNGLIITTTVPMASTRKLVKRIQELGGETLVTAASDKMGTSAKLLSMLNLNGDSKEFLESYVGENYDSLLPLVRSISKLPEKQQYKISINALEDRMPQAPGTVPPWDIEKHIFNGEVNEAISILHRVAQNSDRYLLALAFVRNKMQLLHEVSAILENNPKATSDSIADQLGIKANYGLTIAIRRAKKIGLSKITSATTLLARYDGLIRGRSSIRGIVLMEMLFIELIELLKD